MSTKTTFKKLIQHSLAAAVLAASQGSYAHTTTLLEMTSGQAVDNAVAIGHGCEAQDRAVVAQSVVFPTVNPIITNSDNGDVLSLGLDEVIEGGSLENVADLIQSRDIFLTQAEKTNALGNTVGFYGANGILGTTLLGRVPFQANAPKFADGSCVQHLTVEYAIADICLTSKPTIKNNKVNLWIPDNGSQFAIKGAANGVEGIGEPALLVIHRDSATNPVTDPGACAGAPENITVTISGQDIDANLPIPGWTH